MGIISKQVISANILYPRQSNEQSAQPVKCKMWRYINLYKVKLIREHYFQVSNQYYVAHVLYLCTYMHLHDIIFYYYCDIGSLLFKKFLSN